MNRNRHRLVRNAATGLWTPVAETARGRGKHGAVATLAAACLAALAGQAVAELPVPCAGGACGTHPGTNVPFSQIPNAAAWTTQGNTGYVSQTVDKAIVNFRSFNVSPGGNVVYQRVDNLDARNPVAGAGFTNLTRIWDANPSVIAGSITQAAGQKANVILVNTNGIAFMNGAQVDLNTLTATSLNIADTFVLDQFLTSNTLTPQFEGEGGFVKVLEGARITAGSQGRVMLLAPTVVNRGKVSAPDGQVIAAATTKVYLRSASNSDPNVRGLLIEVDSPAGLADFDTANTGVKDGSLDGETVKLGDPLHDKLGHVTNLGELAAARGNVSMVGFAVNQMGLASATTSVVANGSVYLMAKDRAVNNAQSERGGRVLLGAGSRTEVLPDVADATGSLDGATGIGLAKASQVKVLGQDVRMAGDASITAPSGVVDFIAMDNPGLLDTTNDPLKQAGAAFISTKARVHVADGAFISAAGLEDVEVDVARNVLEAELRGDELKDSPANRNGSLRGESVHLDINRALANAEAGQSTLIAKDSLESYQARVERTVAERSTPGGTVKVRSQGEAILESGAVVDVSGGSLRYTPGYVATSLLSVNGKLVDVADARADVAYDGVATRFVRDYGRWGVTETFELGQSVRYDPGYIEGKDAGAVEVMAMRASVVQADVRGRTTLGELQRAEGSQPKGATLTLGSGSVAGDYKLNQTIEISSTAATLPAGFAFGDKLTAEMVANLVLDPALMGKDKVAHLKAFSNQAAVVRDVLRAPSGGSVTITAKGITIQADVEAAAGAISLAARSNNVDTAVAPLDIHIDDGVTLAVRGLWVNDRPGMPVASDVAALADAGKISLSAVDDVLLGQGSTLDATGGGWLKANGKLVAGKGGDIALEANAGSAAANAHAGRVILGGDLLAHGLGKGGKLTLSTGAIRIDSVADADAKTLDLAPGFFRRGGFADFVLTGRDGLSLADDLEIRPAVLSLDVKSGFSLHATGAPVEDFTDLVIRDDTLRQAANLTLTADATDLGDLRIGAGADIRVDPGASVTLAAGHLLDIKGWITAPGGTITATLNRVGADAHDPSSALWLGAGAKLDVSGMARVWLDADGLVTGEVLDGGGVVLTAQTGYVATDAQSLIDISGAAPVWLDIANEAGGLGMAVGSDAGFLTIAAQEGALLDGGILAMGGGATNRGGRFSLSLGLADRPVEGNYPAGERVLSLAPTVASQATGFSPGSSIPDGLAGMTRVGAAKLETAGFERIELTGWDAIRLEDGLNMGAGRAVPLGEIRLDSPRIESAGGDAFITAEVLRIGNYDEERQGTPSEAVQGTGLLDARARLLELAGVFRLSGMATAKLRGDEEVRLAGIATSTEARPTGLLLSAADLELRGAVVAPTTYSDFTLRAPGRTVAFTSDTSAPTMPLSALGRVKVEADVIEQGGNLWTPFGQIELQADTRVSFLANSLTSVSAESDGLIPFGRVLNGLAWVYESNATAIAQDTLAGKAIRASGRKVEIQDRATLDLSGGGDLQAYEFTVGPGGSSDILAQTGTYAILPGYAGSFAPGDAQEAAGFDLQAGQAVYLSGIPGLLAGTYTLLPAHYALLPGAWTVRLDGAGMVPGQSTLRADGTHLVAGYLTDSRWNAGGPRDALWSGFQVLSRAQVLDRSEFTLTKASSFFADGRTQPRDAGLLSLRTTGTGADGLALGLDAIYDFAPDTSGRGAAVDISAPSLEIVSLTGQATSTADAVPVSVEILNRMGADSLFLGGVRAIDGDTTSLDVKADFLTLANDAGHPLAAEEIILAARNTLTLNADGAVQAFGEAGDAGDYTTAGNGALVRAASTTANFNRTGSPDGGLGTLLGSASARIAASGAITLDATRSNGFLGETRFVDATGKAVAGNLALGGEVISFGAAPEDTRGLVFSQSELDGLGGLASLSLTSYSTFDLYSDVNVGGVDAHGKPTLKSLNLLGAGLAGLDNAGKTAKLRAERLLVANPAAVAYPENKPGLGNGILEILADTLVLGAGDKAIKGYATVDITANELVGNGTGTTRLAAASTAMHLNRVTGERAADQSLAADGGLEVGWKASSRELAEVSALGAKWALSGASLGFDTLAVLPSGQFKLTATSGDLRLGPAAGEAGAQPADSHADIDVAGRKVIFFDVSRASPGGRIELASLGGNVSVNGASKLNVSATSGGDAGDLVVTATGGEFQVSAEAELSGLTTGGGEGAGFELDVAELVDFSGLNDKLDAGGFHGARILRVREQAALAVGSMKAKDIRVGVDKGGLTVNGTLDASGADAGNIALYARDDLILAADSLLDARATGDGENGGAVEIESTAGRLDLAAGKVNVSGGAGGLGGKVRAIAVQTGRVADFTSPSADTGTATAFKVTAPEGVAALTEGLVILFKASNANTTATPTLQVGGLAAKNIKKNGGDNLVAGDIKQGDVVAVMFDGTNFQMVAADTGSGVKASPFAKENIIGAADAALYGRRDYQSTSIDAKLANRVEAEAAVFATIANAASAPTMVIRPATEIRATAGGNGDLTLAADWNLAQANRSGERAGLLTLRATGNLKLNAHLSDGFNVATPLSGSDPATLHAGESWSYRLVAGADTGAADPLAVKAGEADLTLAAGKLVRTGTGDIRIVSGRDILLKDAKSAIYTAGRAAAALDGFTAPANAQYSEAGGSVSLNALRDIVGTASAQLYSNWLFRQGAIDAATGTYTTQPAWWVRFDQFQQGIGALGGGDVNLHAGRNVQNVSASSPTQARVVGAGKDSGALLKTGGGDLRVEAGGDLLGGQYYADMGELLVNAGGRIDSGQKVGAKPLYTLLALGDAQARVFARDNVNIHTILNPHLVVQSKGNGANFNIANAASAAWSLFSTYGEDSAAALSSLSGQVALHNVTNTATTTVAAVKDAYKAPLDFNVSSAKYSANLLSVLPPGLAATAFQDDILVDGTQVWMSPAARGNLTLLAADSIAIPVRLAMSDMDPATIPSVLAPGTGGSQFLPTTTTAHAAIPVHGGDAEPVRVYARDGDATGKANTLNLNLAEAVRVKAGRDVLNLGIQAQHANAGDASLVQAGRDIRFTQSGSGRNDNARIWIGGPGQLEVIAGRDIDLGSSAGIVSRGDLDNAALPSAGVDVRVAAGVGAVGIDYEGAMARLIAALEKSGADEALLWQARWLAGNDNLRGDEALAAARAVDALDAEARRERVRAWIFSALRATGRDSNNPDSPYAADYSRGYAALELLFPGVGATDATGAFASPTGRLNLFASRIKTERGGDIEVFVPGGQVVVGLANTPASLVNVGNQVLGMVTVEEGDIRVFARDDMLVNQSRILTVGGGDILLWSSEGDIDAGKGKKTASAVPPPVIKVDAQGNVTQELQGVATGSGIGALSGQPGISAGDVDLIAPKGTVNAGDAGIRAGNLNIAAQVVLNAENIQVSGASSGVPVADTGGLSAGLAGNNSLGDTQAVAETTRSVGGQSADAGKAVEEAKQALAAFRPSFITVEVLGYGEGTASTGPGGEDASRRERKGG
jgi:filamentous hemagglutinin